VIGSRGSLLCLDRLKRPKSLGEAGLPVLTGSESREERRPKDARGYWSGRGGLGVGGTSFDATEGVDGREWTGLEGRKKEADGSIPPA